MEICKKIALLLVTAVLLGVAGLSAVPARAAVGVAGKPWLPLEAAGPAAVSENMAPIANADSYKVRVDSTLLVTAPKGVLVNDIEPDGDPMTAQLLGGAAQGALVLQPDGAFIYIPKAGYTGSDYFTYQVSDGVENSIPPARVTITIYQPYYAYLPLALR